jgi:hypothetical protein
MAGPENTPWVAALGELLGRSDDGAGGVDHVVDQHAGPALDLADDLLGLDLVLGALHPALVHDRQVGVQLVGVALGDLHTSRIR